MQNINLPLIALLAIGLVNLIISILIIRGARFDRAIEFSLISFTLCSLVLIVSQGIAFSNLYKYFQLDLIQRLSLYCIAAATILLLLLTFRFLRVISKNWFWWIIGAIWLLGSIVLFENIFRLPDIIYSSQNLFISRVNAALASLIAGWGVYMSRSILLLINNYRHAVHPLHRNRLKYWSIVLVLYTTGSIFVFIRQPIIGIFFITTALVTMVYSSLTLHLPDIRQIARRSVSLVSSLILAVLIYSIVIWVLLANNLNLSGVNPTIIAAGAGLAISVLVNPFLNALQRIVHRAVAGDYRDTNELLSVYSKNISNILDLNRLAGAITNLVADAVESKQVSLLLVNKSRDDDRFILLQVNGESAIERTSVIGELSSNSPIAMALNRERLPLTQYDIDLAQKYKGASHLEKQLLTSLQMDVFIPIYLKDRWIGIIALGPKISGDRYFKQELDTLESIADQTAVALENARLYEDLVQRNLENEQLNYELTNANAELSRLDKAKSDFISIASHELRTPLTQILGYNDIIGDLVQSGSVPISMGNQMVDSVRKAAQRLEEIVDTMFDVSKLDTNTLELVQSPTLMPIVIASVVDKWSKALQERKLAITVKNLNTLPAIEADGKRLIQVFSHLVQNAIKSTPNGGKIRITGQVIEDDADKKEYVEIIVADTGIGISSEDLERIFDKFYRVGNIMLHSTGDTKFKGAGPGLGLTIARGIIEAHHGRIWAESPGYDEVSLPGTKLHVLLPVTGQVRDQTVIYPRIE